MNLKTLWDKLPKRLRQQLNKIDDPFDAALEFLHCCRIPLTQYQLNLSFLMKNRETSWDIIRKHKFYSNCDPEDKK